MKATESDAMRRRRARPQVGRRRLRTSAALVCQAFVGVLGAATLPEAGGEGSLSSMNRAVSINEDRERVALELLMNRLAGLRIEAIDAAGRAAVISGVDGGDKLVRVGDQIANLELASVLGDLLVLRPMAESALELRATLREAHLSPRLSTSGGHRPVRLILRRPLERQVAIPGTTTRNADTRSEPSHRSEVAREGPHE